MLHLEKAFFSISVLYFIALDCGVNVHITATVARPLMWNNPQLLFLFFYRVKKKIVKARQTESLKSIWVFFVFFLTALQKKLELWFGDLFDHLFLFFCLWLNLFFLRICFKLTTSISVFSVCSSRFCWELGVRSSVNVIVECETLRFDCWFLWKHRLSPPRPRFF